MIEGSNVTSKSGNDGNSIIITFSVELTEEEASDYIELDELLVNNDLDELLDLLSDNGWSYSDDVLVTFNWLSLKDVLQQAREIVEQKAGKVHE